MSDFWNECFDGRTPPEQFSATFCRVCKNPECSRAQWGQSKWTQRMSTQVERLLLNPKFADPSDPKYRPLREKDFPDLLRKALALEISTRKGDWSVPTTAEVVSEVTKLTTKTRAESPSPEPPPSPARFVQPDPEPVEPPQATASESPTPEPPPPPATPQKPAQGQRSPNLPRSFNTPMPESGIMVGGGAPPKPKATKPERDPWAVPEKPKNVVERGATIRMGGGKPPGEDKT